MTDRYDVFYESPDGDTSNATQPFLPLEWSEASLTFRRRAPHSGTITIPGSSHHVPSDFKAGREIIIKRNGQHWFAGIMDMPSISGERGKRGMQLPMWGQAKVLDFYRNSVTDTLLTDAQDGLTTTTLVNGYLALAVHGVFGTDAAWFPSAGRSLSLKSTIIPHWVMSGKSILQVVTELCDYDGLSWYVGVDSSGGWTFTTSSAAPC